MAAVDIGDIEKVCLLYEHADTLLKQATPEQVGGAHPWILHTAA